MKILVLGGGLQGSACAYDLLTQDDVTLVTLADLRPDAGADFLPDDSRLERVALDFKDDDAVVARMNHHDVVLSAAPYYFNTRMARLAIEARCDYSDLGGNTEIVFEQLDMAADAEHAGVTLIPDVGLAPGLINVLGGAGIRRLDKVESVMMYVGGLPQHPKPPLNYQVVYSLQGALDYYTTPAWVIRNGEPTQVEALSEIEELEFDELGTLQAFHTGGGSSIMPWQFEGKVDRLEYKTLRYPGHAEIMRSVRDLGLLDKEEVSVGEDSVVPRDVFISVVSPHLTRPDDPDVVALRVVATGTRDGARVVHTWDLLDKKDEAHGLTSMMRTTGYTLSIVGLLMGRDVISRTGVFPADEGIPEGAYLDELAKRGVNVRYAMQIVEPSAQPAS